MVLQPSFRIRFFIFKHINTYKMEQELQELRMYSYKCTEALQKIVFLFEKVNNDDLYEPDVEALKDFINTNL